MAVATAIIAESNRGGTALTAHPRPTGGTSSVNVLDHTALARHAALDADGFGHWLAGFIDGEGCFRLHTLYDSRYAYTYYACYFALDLRDDDTAVLEECVKRTGLGRVTF